LGAVRPGSSSAGARQPPPRRPRALPMPSWEASPSEMPWRKEEEWYSSRSGLAAQIERPKIDSAGGFQGDFKGRPKIDSAAAVFLARAVAL
jgi:hypothetical protein